jgi:hypothetical protein
VIPCGCHAMPASQHQLPLLMHHLVIHLAHGPWGPATSINRLGWAGLGWVREPNGVKQLCGVAHCPWGAATSINRLGWAGCVSPTVSNSCAAYGCGCAGLSP